MIDGARIESEDDGFRLVLLGDFDDEVARYTDGRDGDHLVLRLSPDAVFELLHAARRELGPWVAEYEFHQSEFRRGLHAVDDDEGYGVDDPKRPGWSERVADRADMGRKRAKGE